MSLLDAALAFHKAGCSVVPARPDGTKAPSGNWKQFTRVRATDTAIRAWFSDGTYDGFGIVCGAVSGNLEMLELEGRAVTEDMLTKLSEVAEATGLGDLWRRVMDGYREASPTWGIHFLYRVDGVVAGNTKLARRPGLGDTVQVLSETRGEGGYVVVAPSAGRTHPSGKPWMLLSGSADTIPTITAAERDQLHILARTLDDMPQETTWTGAAESSVTNGTSSPTTSPGSTRGPSSGVGAAGSGPGVADDYNARTTWDELLTPRGWKRLHTSGKTTYWRRPDKPDGISATTGRNDGDNIFIFSTSTTLPDQRALSKFAVYAHLEHAGNYSAAGKALFAAGFGDHKVPPSIRELIEEGPWPSNSATSSGTSGGPTPAAGSSSKPAHDAASTPTTPSDQEPAAEDDPASWAPFDFTDILAGTYVPETPTLFPRSDGPSLLYVGKVHSFHGESESGKSFLAQAETARLVQLGEKVLYVDYESDAATIVGRLLEMGCSGEQITTGLTYIRPEASPYHPSELEAWRALLRNRYSLAVLDGVTDALGLSGASSKDNDEIVAWMRSVPRIIATYTGAAVVLIDHVTKDDENRGRHAIGGVAKMNRLDGAAYIIEVVKPLGRGLLGEVSMRVGKDRPGEVRPHSGRWRATDRTQESARVVVDSTQPGRVLVIVGPPPSKVGDVTHGDDDSPFRFTGIMEKVSRLLEASGEEMGRNDIVRSLKKDGVKGREANVLAALNTLVEEGFLTTRDGGNKSKPVTHLRPYRQRQDPESDNYEPPLGGYDPDDEQVLPSASQVLPSASREAVKQVLPSASQPHPYGVGSSAALEVGLEPPKTSSAAHFCTGCGTIPARGSDILVHGKCLDCRVAGR
jgi:hypothetical protein